MRQPRVVACRDVVRAERARVPPEAVELDMPVAPDIWVGRAALLVTAQERFKDIRPVLAHKRGLVKADSQVVAHPPRIACVLLAAVATALLGRVPVAHMNADDIVALVAQEEGGDGGVDAAADTHGHRRKMPSGRQAMAMAREERMHARCPASDTR